MLYVPVLGRRSIFPKLLKDWTHIGDVIVLFNIVCTVPNVNIGHIDSSVDSVLRTGSHQGSLASTSRLYRARGLRAQQGLYNKY